MTGENKSSNLDGKIAIVTGSAQGIGKSIAAVLAKNGAIVVVSDILSDKGEATAKGLRDPAIFVPCDISDVAQVRSLVDNVIQRFGRLDIMVNNAGINSTRPEDRVTIDEYPDETWNRIIDVDLNGTFSALADRVVSFIPQGRPGTTEEIANAVAFLISDQASYLNGHNLVVDGGWTSGFNRDF